MDGATTPRSDRVRLRRGVLVRGRGRRVDDPAEHLLALRAVTDHVVSNWDTGRTSTASELRRTMVIAVPL